MSMSLPDMRLMITRPLGINVGGTGMATSQLDLYLNRSFWEVQNKFPFREKEVVSTFDTSAGGRLYEVSFPTEAVKHLAIEEIDGSGVGQHHPLEKIERDVYEQLYKANSEDHWGIPTKYVREGCVIRLFPTPDDVYTITIKRLVALSDFSATNVTSGIPQVWDEIIGFGGTWRAALDLGDVNKASFYKSLQAEMINTIIPTESDEAQSNAQLASVTVLGLDYD